MFLITVKARSEVLWKRACFEDRLFRDILLVHKLKTPICRTDSYKERQNKQSMESPTKLKIPCPSNVTFLKGANHKRSLEKNFWRSLKIFGASSRSFVIIGDRLRSLKIFLIELFIWDTWCFVINANWN